MSDLEINPYDAPQSDLGQDEIAAGSVADLRNVVRWQRTLIICLAIIVIAAPLEFFLANIAHPVSRRGFFPIVIIIIAAAVLSLAAITAYVIGIFSIYRLSARLWGTVLGAILGIASVAVPVAVVMVLVVHICTTRLLKSYGLKVGLFWTDLSEVDRWAGESG